MTIRVAGAPVSFGVFELTPSDLDFPLPTADDVVSILESTGYTGVDLGPGGFLGRGEQLRQRLVRHGLELAGGWIDLPFATEEDFTESLTRLDLALDAFSEATTIHPRAMPLPTLADSGDERRRSNPGGGEGLSLDETGWTRLATNVQLAADHVRRRGFEPTFHHHACTYVETPSEVDEFLRRTDIGLTFDTGHVLVGGGDPIESWKRWSSRINHVHIKDVRTDVLETVLANGGGMLDLWASGTFVPLGDGDLDVPEIMNAIVGSGFDGWIVVEQDFLPTPETTLDQLRRDHVTNRTALQTWT